MLRQPQRRRHICILTGKAKNKITIQTPKGIAYTADITDIKRSENEVSCAVIKDGGMTLM